MRSSAGWPGRSPSVSRGASCLFRVADCYRSVEIARCSRGRRPRSRPRPPAPPARPSRTSAPARPLLAFRKLLGDEPRPQRGARPYPSWSPIPGVFALTVRSVLTYQCDCASRPSKGTPVLSPTRHRIGHSGRWACTRVALSPAVALLGTPRGGCRLLFGTRRAALALLFPMPGPTPPLSGYRVAWRRDQRTPGVGRVVLGRSYGLRPGALVESHRAATQTKNGAAWSTAPPLRVAPCR
jgi:hypothetical protein